MNCLWHTTVIYGGNRPRLLGHRRRTRMNSESSHQAQLCGDWKVALSRHGCLTSCSIPWASVIKQHNLTWRYCAVDMVICRSYLFSRHLTVRYSLCAVTFAPVNPSTPTAVLWVELQSILCQTGLSRHLSFLTSGHSDAQGWNSTLCPQKNMWLHFL